METPPDRYVLISEVLVCVRFAERSPQCPDCCDVLKSQSSSSMKMRVDDLNRQFYQRIQSMLDLPSINDAATLAATGPCSRTVRRASPTSKHTASRTERGDQFNLKGRFVDNQRTVFETALEEIRAGSKKTHWMWFVIPTPPYIDGGKEKGRCVCVHRTERERECVTDSD